MKDCPKNGQKRSLKENDTFSVVKVVGTALELITKVQVPIKRYGLKLC